MPAVAFFCSYGMSAESRIRRTSMANCPLLRAAIPASGYLNLLRPKRPFVTPRALTATRSLASSRPIASMPATLNGQVSTASRSTGANGYLLDQFLQDGSNHRTDDYGGSIENRRAANARSHRRCCSVGGARRVGVHLAPRGDLYSMGDSSPATTFGYVAEQLGQPQHCVHRRSRIGWSRGLAPN